MFSSSFKHIFCDLFMELPTGSSFSNSQHGGLQDPGQMCKAGEMLQGAALLPCVPSTPLPCQGMWMAPGGLDAAGPRKINWRHVYKVNGYARLKEGAINPVNLQTQESWGCGNMNRRLSPPSPWAPPVPRTQASDNRVSNMTPQHPKTDF